MNTYESSIETMVGSMFFVLLIIDAIRLANAFNCKSDSPTSKLVFAHVIHRHGNRSILYTFENDPYKDPDYWPYGFGQLTDVGKKTTYELGKYLRRRYKQLIGTSDNQVYIQSSDVMRARKSAQCVVAGLFATSEHQKRNECINWQHIPIHTVPWAKDYLLIQAIPCKKNDQLQRNYFQSKEMAALLEKFRHFGNVLEKHGGTPINTVFDYYKYFDSLYIENLLGLPLPDWAKTAIEKSNGTLEFLAAHFLESFTHTRIMQKVRAGFLIKDMINRFKDKISKRLNPDRSLWIYSAHDLTIISVLNTLGLYKFEMSPFASSLHVELYEDNLNYYVQFFYRTDSSECVAPLNLPICGTKCKLSDLYAIFRDILPKKRETFESLCKPKPNCKQQIK